MKILMVNNQLYVLGGSETYMFSVGDELSRLGNDVEYFGLEDPDHLHGNKYGIYAIKSKSPFSYISNRENIKRFGEILDKFKPDIVHMNLVYFTLTEDIIYESKKRNIPIIQTIHDSKIVCPSHRLYIEHKGAVCSQCLHSSNFLACVTNRCIKGSFARSLIACIESNYYKNKGAYSLVDKYIFVCKFMMNLHIGRGVSEKQSIVLYNFSRIKKRQVINKSKERYVLYFGRLGKEKGMVTLAEVCKATPKIKYKLVGTGDMGFLFKDLDNCELLGFKSGNELENIIAEAVCSVLPSIWYENCPMTVLESIALGTPVIGSDRGGIPELIKQGQTGFVFESENEEALKERIEELYFNQNLAQTMAYNCIKDDNLLGIEDYTNKLLLLYESLIRKE